MKLSSIVKLLLGTILGISILLGASAAVGYYFLTRLTQTPPKPIFANDIEATNPPAKVTKTSTKSGSAAGNSTSSKPSGYRARVVFPDGLLLRDSPSVNANQIGDVAHNEEVIVLAESSDQLWQRVRLETEDVEGWVKAGYIERIE